MEFHQKLQELRKQKGLTQNELAEILFVSRTAVSKWEAGRGYPSIDSLKAISRFFSVSIDDLLSCNEVLTIAEEDTRRNASQIRDLVFGLLDVLPCVLLFLPFFGQSVNGQIQEVSLLAFTGAAPFLQVVYCTVIILMIVLGMLTLVLLNCRLPLWLRYKHHLSLLINAAAALLFILGRQPYAASLLFIFLLAKGFLLLKKL